MLASHLVDKAICRRPSDSLIPFNLHNPQYTHYTPWNKPKEDMDLLSLLRRDDKQVAAYRAACTLETCPIQNSYYNYRPSLGTNAAFLALFSLSLSSFILQAALSRRFVGFTIAMVSGCSLEVLGYIGRIMSWHNPFNQVSIHPLSSFSQRCCRINNLIIERIPYANCLLDNRPRLSRCRHLSHPLPHRHHIRS